MSVVAAAPHLFDDPLVASPELALVDGDLAARLREEVQSGVEFRPRPVARPEFRLLHPVLSAAEASVDSEPEDVAVDVEPVVVALEAGGTPEMTDADPELSEDVATAQEPDDVVTPAALVEVALEPPLDSASELPDYVVVADGAPVATEEPPTAELADVSESLDDVGGAEERVDAAPAPGAFLEVALEPPLTPVSELPDYVVVADDTPVPTEEQRTRELADVSEPLDDVGAAEERVDAASASAAFLEVALEPPLDSASELPDYVVVADDTPVPTEELVDPEHADAAAGSAAFLDVALEPPLDSASELPDYVVAADPAPVATDEPADPAPTISDYPVLPDLDEASEALEETDAALRKIREQFVSEEFGSQTGPRLRRGFVVASGLGAVTALGVFAVDVQLGVVAVPGWLGF